MLSLEAGVAVLLDDLGKVLYIVHSQPPRQKFDYIIDCFALSATMFLSPISYMYTIHVYSVGYECSHEACSFV